MAKQTLVFESPMELSLRDGMIVITDRSTEKTSLRSLEDIQLVMIDHHSVRISGMAGDRSVASFCSFRPYRWQSYKS